MSLKEIFKSMRTKLDQYDENYKQELFDADLQREKMNIDRYVNNIEDLI